MKNPEVMFVLFALVGALAFGLGQCSNRHSNRHTKKVEVLKTGGYAYQDGDIWYYYMIDSSTGTGSWSRQSSPPPRENVEKEEEMDVEETVEGEPSSEPSEVSDDTGSDSDSSGDSSDSGSDFGGDSGGDSGGGDGGGGD